MYYTGDVARIDEAVKKIIEKSIEFTRRMSERNANVWYFHSI